MIQKHLQRAKKQIGTGVVLGLVALTGLQAHAGERIQFNRDIRPILSDNCYLCHGPDHSTRKADLRLDIPEGIIADLGDGRQAVVPGNPEESELYQRITADTAGGIMPPPESHKTLDQDQIGKLKAWIAEGAGWEDHWSFKTIQRPDVPGIGNAEWASNPIDHYIFQRLEKEHLVPSEEADKYTLIRRVSFDLCGLPPSPAEIDAFVHDASPDAYEKMVDRFLASKHYGEHRARYWLDAARYSDTHGFHLDNYRSIWPYRDWVVKAFNTNMPFDQFTVEQLAGDLLPHATQSQKVATGFNRCNPTTSEGGAINDEYLAIYAADRTETTSTVWLGLTMGCAACHDHKFDPLSQRDFYEMTAFFRNTTQKAMDGNIYDTPPALRLYNEAAMARKHKIEPRLSTIKTALSGLEKPSTNSVAAAQNGLDWLAGDAQEPDSHAFGDFSKDDPFTLSFWIFMPTNSLKSNQELFGKTGKKGSGWRVQLNKDRKVNFSLIDDSASPMKLTLFNNEPLMTNAWNHIAFTYTGLYRFGAIDNYTPAFSMFLNGKTAKAKGVHIKQKFKGDIRNTGTFKINLTGKNKDGIELKDVKVYNQRLSEPEKVLLSSAYMSDAVILTNTLSKGALPIPGTQELQPLLNEFRTLERELAELKQTAPITLVMQEKNDSEPFAHLLNRGQYDQPLDKVLPDMPAALPPMPEGKRDRLVLARWLVDPANPLPARVTVNRCWQELFGTGIVKTSEDFGSQGEPPTHPGLLDWLAAEFIESGWDVKHMYKLMLMSSTYRQASKVTPEQIKADPENRLLARGPRYRLDAETIRDQALCLSDLLVDQTGGPPVKPFQPYGVWKAVAYTGSNTATFEADRGDKLYRRSLYTFWKRTAPPPSMSIFDAPSRESCSVRRERTNTPLQALVLMNDPQFVEAARNFAQLILAHPDEDKFKTILYMALGHEPDTQAAAALKNTYAQVLPIYQADTEAAKQLIAIGESKADDSLDPAELAAWTIVANQVMNMDAFITKN